MKKLIVFGIIAMIPFLVSAQGTPLSDLIDRYSEEPGFETSLIMPASMSLEWEQDLKDTPVRDLLNQIESVKILKYNDQAEGNVREKTWKKIQKAAADDLYTEIASISSDKITVRAFIIKGSDGTTREVAMISENESGLMMMAMTGHMDFSSFFSPENLGELREMGEYFMKNKGGCKHPEGQ